DGGPFDRAVVEITAGGAPRDYEPRGPAGLQQPAELVGIPASHGDMTILGIHQPQTWPHLSGLSGPAAIHLAADDNRPLRLRLGNHAEHAGQTKSRQEKKLPATGNRVAKLRHHGSHDRSFPRSSEDEGVETVGHFITVSSARFTGVIPSPIPAGRAFA